jgi:nitric oxide reductase NorE protein
MTSPTPNAPARFIPGQPDMWFFVLFEMLVFTSYFVVYMFIRATHNELFLQYQAKLDVRVGVLNTLLMLASSWAMARGVQAARAGAFRSAMAYTAVTAGLGFAFLVVKVVEWVRLIRLGYGFTTNDFFMHYFFLTAIHAVHLLIGFVALGVVVYQLRTRRSQELIETSATYWHTVDVLWVLIFSLLYVVR